MRLSSNQKLAFSAFILSFLALIVGLTTPVNKYATSKTSVEYISVLELATEIKNKEHLQLFDLRSDSSYSAFHIPTAKNVSTAQLLKLKPDSKTKTVLYSRDENLSIQSFLILKEIGTANLFVLKGGIRDWYDRILYPKIPILVPETDKELANQIKSISAFYGGRPVRTEEENSLEYYRGTLNTFSIKKTTKLVRMGC